MKRLFNILGAILALAFACQGQTADSGYPEPQLAPNYATDTGSVNALVATVNSCPSAYKIGAPFRVLPANANTASTPTLNYCGFGAKTITKFGSSTALSASDLTTNAIAEFVYDGTDLELQNPQSTTVGVPTNAQTGTSYTIASSDRASYVSFSNAGAIAVTLPQAGTTGFANNFVFKACDIGAGTATITPTTSTISYTNGSSYTSGASSLALTTGQCAFVYSDNTNYFANTSATGGGGSGTVSSGTQGQRTIYNATGTTVSGVTNPYIMGPQSTGTDIGAPINAVATTFTSAGGEIDATGIVPRGGLALMDSNFFASANHPIKIDFGNYTVALCVPIVTPQTGSKLIGTFKANLNTAGTVFRAGTTTDGCSSNFPSTTAQITTTWQHGPFASGTYASLVNIGGNVSTGAAVGLSDSFNTEIANIYFDGNNLADFDIFSSSCEEDCYIHDLLVTGDTSALMFFDREFQVGVANGGGAGPTHFTIERIEGSNNEVSGAYGIVYEGNTTFISFNGTCSTQPTAYTYTISGVPQAPTLTGGGNCSVLPTTCTLHASVGSGNVCALTASGTAVTAISFSTAGTGYAPVAVPGGGPHLSNMSLTATSSSFKYEDQVWIEGDYNSEVHSKHCENVLDACIRHGSGSAPYVGGIFDAMDSATDSSSYVVAFGPGAVCWVSGAYVPCTEGYRANASREGVNGPVIQDCNFTPCRVLGTQDTQPHSAVNYFPEQSGGTTKTVGPLTFSNTATWTNGDALEVETGSGNDFNIIDAGGPPLTASAFLFTAQGWCNGAVPTTAITFGLDPFETAATTPNCTALSGTGVAFPSSTATVAGKCNISAFASHVSTNTVTATFNDTTTGNSVTATIAAGAAAGHTNAATLTGGISLQDLYNITITLSGTSDALTSPRVTVACW